MGKVEDIARRKKIRAPMETLNTVTVDEKTGLAGDIRGGALKRQVTILSAEAWNSVCEELKTELPWTTRRANILVSGIKLPQESGYQIQIGEVLLEVTRQTDPCERMDEQYLGLTNALMPDWRGGVCCSVVRGGNIMNGDKVTLYSKE
ncbi:MAG: MOSC domain-containing protein [Woeseiaceae bacterium]|jgi:MOSC domain-containing protein YiiM|nr:MOSC domain-containing protein [Woeseiaceae bacterium]|tara:strand:+ start:1229 stop:1672 length:444 start_codon:yes stop_codon:yes gene_type:complete